MPAGTIQSPFSSDLWGDHMYQGDHQMLTLPYRLAGHLSITAPERCTTQQRQSDVILMRRWMSRNCAGASSTKFTVRPILTAVLNNRIPLTGSEGVTIISIQSSTVSMRLLNNAKRREFTALFRQFSRRRSSKRRKNARTVPRLNTHTMAFMPDEAFTIDAAAMMRLLRSASPILPRP